MNEQLSFLNLTQDSFIDQLQDMLNKLILDYELPRKSLHLFSNISRKGKNSGKEISKSICIYEPEYPCVKEDIDNPGKNYIIMNLKQENNLIKLRIRNSQFKAINLPNSASVKAGASSDGFITVVFKASNIDLLPYIERNIKYCIANYHTKEKSFGCCSSFVKCSDAQKCTHENKLYSTACIYRRHLEAGHIFYGKNKNI